MDKVEQMSGAVVQHGPENQRIYVMEWQTSPTPAAAVQFRTEAQARGYTKIIAKVPASSGEIFVDEGYALEAKIPGFFQGMDDAWFCAYYLAEERQMVSPEVKDRMTAVLATADDKDLELKRQIESSYRWIRCELGQEEEMAKVYRSVFATYPFPITDTDYIRQTMAEKSVWYYAALDPSGAIAALAAAEYNPRAMAVEMTDFATLPAHRGQGLAQFLLGQMERDVAEQGVLTAFTIARAMSFGMNASFAKLGYCLGGTLINNTNIAGQMESMNIWYKTL